MVAVHDGVFHEAEYDGYDDDRSVMRSTCDIVWWAGEEGLARQRRAVGGDETWLRQARAFVADIDESGAAVSCVWCLVGRSRGEPVL